MIHDWPEGEHMRWGLNLQGVSVERMWRPAVGVRLHKRFMMICERAGVRLYVDMRKRHKMIWDPVRGMLACDCCGSAVMLHNIDFPGVCDGTRSVEMGEEWAEDE